MRFEDDGYLSVVEAHQIADRVDAHQLHESPHQVLIELLAVVPLQYGEDAVGRKSRLIHPMRSHRVVHVGDAAQRRGKIELGPLRARDPVPSARR